MPTSTAVMAMYLLHFGQQQLWNHKILPAPKKEAGRMYPHGIRWSPPADICATSYPAMGLYSSADKSTLRHHMQLLSKVASIDHIVVPFYISSSEVRALHPQTAYLKEGERTIDARLPSLLDTAADFGIRVSFFLADWEGRGGIPLIISRVKYLVQTYQKYSAFHPLVFIQNPKLNSQRALLQWRAGIKGFKTTPVEFVGAFDDIAIIDINLFAAAHFHGLMIDGDIKDNMLKQISKVAPELQLTVTVSPGRDASKIRPWAFDEVVKRKGGVTYQEAWDKALSIRPDSILIFSFNDWCQGTQIEGARAVSANSIAAGKKRSCSVLLKNLGLNDDYLYTGYENDDPNIYLEMTRDLISRTSDSSL